MLGGERKRASRETKADITEFKKETDGRSESVGVVGKSLQLQS